MPVDDNSWIYIMVSIQTLLDSIVVDLKKHFTELKTCVVLPGYIETTELVEVHKNTPGVFVAHVGNGEITHVETGQSDITLQLVMYLLVVDQPGEADGIANAVERERVAQDLLSRLLTHMSASAQRWGMAEAFPATAIESADVHGLTNNFTPHTRDWRLGTAVLSRAADLYGGNDPISRLALWAITWEQKLRMGENRLADIGADQPPEPQGPDSTDEPLPPTDVWVAVNGGEPQVITESDRKTGQR